MSGIAILIVSLILYKACNSLTAISLPSLNDIIPPDGRILRHFLVSRPPESKSHEIIQHFIRKHFERLDWKFENDTFRADTPMGPKRFTNLIATLNHGAQERIILAAHYDSKLFVVDKDGKERKDFIGATDSAWSCAFLIHLSSKLRHIKASGKLGIQMVFFDGEEALVEWNDTDSIYGAKHLAQQWSQSKLPHQDLSRIKFMMLLDLLGSKDTKLYSFFPDTFRYFVQLSQIEQALRTERRLMTNKTIFIHEYALKGKIGAQYTMGDDHVPFAQRNVPIIHLIPYPFPSVWHQIQDNADALDPATCHDTALIIETLIIRLMTQHP